MKWIQAPFLLIRLIPLSIILLLTGCSYFQNPSVRLCTDKSVFAAYTEVFNASQDKYRLEICYLEKPIDLLQSKNVVPDLLIGTGLWDPALLEEFEPLNDLFENNHIDERGFYRELLNLGRKEGKQYLFPVNFNLPVIIMEDQRPEDAASNMLIALDTLKQQGVEYNVKQNGLYKKMGFSPLWNDRFLYYTAVLYGAHFQVDAQGQIKWNQKELQDALEFLKAWIIETNGGYETERAFTERYMKIPDYRLLA
ncbi:MAG TPA: hypothetical protein VMX75_13610, partial [Spirochaetia bacterium]|nr:hypothetical protein [Spirochaetia bacterium]